MSTDVDQMTDDGPMMQDTQTETRPRRFVNWVNNSPTFEIWFGIVLMYLDVAAITLLNSWYLAWTVPIAVFFMVSGVAEKMAKDPYRREG